MFTIEQIIAAHSKVKSGADFPKYIQELKALGVFYYDLFVADGHAVYYGEGRFTITGKANYPVKIIADTGSATMLHQALAIHQQGQTDYPTFCVQAAAAGVEKWTVQIQNMEVIYWDKPGNKLVAEPVPAG